MTHSMRVTLQCPLCDDGSLTATVSPDSIDDLEDAGCGHAAELWATPDATWLLTAKMIWAAVSEEEARRYDDEMDSRYARERDR